MPLMTIRLELGRAREAPQGDPRHGYEFIAPLDRHGHLDAELWGKRRQGARCAAFARVRASATDCCAMSAAVGASTISPTARRMMNPSSSWHLFSLGFFITTEKKKEKKGF